MVFARLRQYDIAGFDLVFNAFTAHQRAAFIDEPVFVAIVVVVIEGSSYRYFEDACAGHPAPVGTSLFVNAFQDGHISHLSGGHKLRAQFLRRQSRADEPDILT
ncbi:MAG: hypothetical protein BWY76_02333 [bacterium ADurb.Bin429]|nr:MAG: hypothetical protein BWY76_02333 [bacterium ADurb.Bin429]